MPSDAAELRSVVTSLREIEQRITEIAERYQGTTRDDLLAALYEAERFLRGAVRSTEHAVRLAP